MTERPDNPLNIVSLRDYTERLFEESQRAVDAALRNQENSLERARTHIEAIFDEHRRAHDQKHVDDERAQDAARTAIDLRLEKLNELRSEVLQDRSQFVRRDLYDADVKSLNEKLEAVRSWQNKAVGAGVILTLLAGTVGALILKLFG